MLLTITTGVGVGPSDALSPIGAGPEGPAPGVGANPETTRFPATDLGWLLHKNPARAQAFDLTFGKAHVIWPEASEERATVALILEVDPVALSRSGRRDENRPLQPYVNDRPYVASSFLSVAIGDVFGTALAGRCKDRPELPEVVFPLEVGLDVLPCRGGERLLRALFEPLGWAVACERLPLDPTFPEWGDSAYFRVRLTGEMRLRELLGHLYVLVPVLDDEKHYWVGDAEVEKLLRHGEGWLSTHPERELVARRYLKYRSNLAREALSRLSGGEAPPEEERTTREEKLEERISLNDTRLATVHEALKRVGARRVVDVGCGEGKLLYRIARDKAFDEVIGVDVSLRALDIAEERLDRLPESAKTRAKLLHGSVTYRDARLKGFDAAACIEVIEHLELERVPAFERALFGFAAPNAVVLTTPNCEYNVKFANAPGFRHDDHRFEWTRAEFLTWAERVAREHGYVVVIEPIGPEDPDLGAPTQMAIFTRVGPSGPTPIGDSTLVDRSGDPARIAPVDGTGNPTGGEVA